MKAVLGGKLYDTDKSEYVCTLEIPQNDFCGTVDEFDVCKTAKGNIFAEHKNADCLIKENILKTILSRRIAFVLTLIFLAKLKKRKGG